VSQSTHIWYWRSRLPERKGQPCRVIATGRMNSILVEFEDGHRVITSRYAVRQKTLERKSVDSLGATHKN
jgi:hypothetical protein